MKYLKLIITATALVLSINVNAYIVVEGGESLTVDYYEAEGISPVHGTLNVLEGGSVDLYAVYGSLNILGGEVRTAVRPGGAQVYMSSGYMEGTISDGGRGSITVEGGTVGAEGLKSTGNIYVHGGVIEGVVQPEWGGEANLYGGVFENNLSSVGGGSFHIYGGEYQGEIYQTLNYLSMLSIDFYGYDLSMTAPEIISSGNENNYLYNTQVTGYLSDGNYIDMSVTYNESHLHGGVTLNTVSAVPVPAAVWLFGSGLLGLIGFARRKKS